MRVFTGMVCRRGKGMLAVALGLSAVCITVSAWAVAAVRREASPLRLVSVGVLTDHLDARSGGLVRVELDDGSTETALTDTDGQTPWFNLDVRSGARITLGEGPVEGGRALGAVEEWPGLPMIDGDEEQQEWLVVRTQPVARELLIEGKEGETVTLYPERGDYPHWLVVLPDSSPLRFQAHVGLLMDGESVSQYMAYRGQPQVSSSDYVRGVVLVTSNVALGKEGLLIGIDLHGDLGPGDVTADVFNFHGDTLSFSEQTLDAHVFDLIGDRLFIQLTGGILEGQLAVLVRSKGTAPGVAEYVLDNPPDLDSPSGDGGKVAVLTSEGCEGCTSLNSRVPLSAPSPGALAKDCEPEPFDPPKGWTCRPPEPGPWNRCGGGEVQGPVNCKITRLKSPRICLDPGKSFKAQRASVTSFKVTFEFGGQAGYGENELSTTSGFQYGVSRQSVITDSWTADPGVNGVGQCSRWYRQYLHCMQLWLHPAHAYRFDGVELTEIRCGGKTADKTVCQDLAITSAVCDRTP